MKFICPLISVSDIKRSRDFYERILFQKVKYDFGENITFHGDFAIHLQSHFKDLIGNRKIQNGANNFELYFEYDNVEIIEKRLKENNIVLIHEAKEQPWRQKVVRFYDPDKHIIEVGETMEYLAYRLESENMNIKQIATTINMPIYFVKNAINKFEKL